ncbi:hypothetical protein GEMRC1_007559 [Eukaryota sp. GEM-RC1]
MSTHVELIPFLSDDNPKVRELAIRELSSFTTSVDLCYSLVTHGVLKPVVSLLADSDPNVVHFAITILINISAEQDLLSQLINSGLVSVLMEHIMSNSQWPFLQLALMLLSNLSISEEGSQTLMQENSNLEGSFIIKLLVEMAKPVSSDSDKCSFIPQIIANVSRLSSFKNLILIRQPSLLEFVLEQLTSSNIRRRGGSVATLRNLLFSEDCHLELLTDPKDLVWNSLKRGLSVKNLESDPYILLLLAECLFLLTSTEKAMKILRDFDVEELINELMSHLNDDSNQFDDSDRVEVCSILEKTLKRLDDYNFVDVQLVTDKDPLEPKSIPKVDVEKHDFEEKGGEIPDEMESFMAELE